MRFFNYLEHGHNKLSREGGIWTLGENGYVDTERTPHEEAIRVCEETSCGGTYTIGGRPVLELRIDKNTYMRTIAVVGAKIVVTEQEVEHAPSS